MIEINARIRTGANVSASPRGAAVMTLCPLAHAEGLLQPLMLRGLDGDAAAHRELLKELDRLICPYFQGQTGGAERDVDDLVEEVLTAVHTRRATYDRDQPLMAWVYAIARYKLTDHLRRRRVRPFAPTGGDERVAAARANSTQRTAV